MLRFRLSVLLFSVLNLNLFCQPTIITADTVIIKDTSIWGIDISKYQIQINWDTVCKRNKPYFLYHKVTEGVTIYDTSYKTRKKLAKDKNILFGAYHFFSYRSTGILQFNNFLKYADVENGELIPVLDLELRRHMPNHAWVVKEIKTFCRAFEKHYGFKPILYCNYYYYNTYLKGNLEGYKYWICDIHGKPKINWIFWQHSHKSKLQGIKGYVDHNYFNGSFEELKALQVKN